jgi:2-iminobutanoate/2-iminopropanoate deaminase
MKARTAMNRIYNPSTVAPPAGRYSLAIEVPPNAKWLYISGQVGTAVDGSVPPDIHAQAANCWRNIVAILTEAGMTIGDLVKVSVFLTREQDIPAYREARDRTIGEARPASTLLVISKLASPAFLVEVEAIAAKA